MRDAARRQRRPCGGSVAGLDSCCCKQHQDDPQAANPLTICRIQRTEQIFPGNLLLAIHQSQVQSRDGLAFPIQCVAWKDAPVLDACAVQAEHGHLLVLTADGAVQGIDFDSGTATRLCTVELQDLSFEPGNRHFGAPAHRLHASQDGKNAAIVTDTRCRGCSNRSITDGSPHRALVAHPTAGALP